MVMGKEVVFVKKSFFCLSEEEIDHMIAEAYNNETHKYRYCLHENENSGMQEMIFVQLDDVISRPHKHPYYAESQMILRGSALLMLMDEKGDIYERHIVSEQNNRIWRIDKDIYHVMVPTTPEIVIYEVREGRFDNGSNFYPSWEKNIKGIEFLEM